jgi:hypothetical protein
MKPTTKTIILAAAALFAADLGAQAQDGKASQFLPLANEPEAKLFVDPPATEPLAARGTAVIPYRTENFRILPIFGVAASGVSPRAGHLHVTVDDLPWHWADAGDTGSVVVAGLPAGVHKVLIELATPEHQAIVGQTVTFTVPAPPGHTH